MGEKEKILSKFNIKNYKNELELILDKKAFDEEAKSLLLNICYKLENFYKDYSMVKKDCESKIVLIEEFIELIKNRCNKIKIVSPKECAESKYSVNIKEGIIKTFPNELILMYALYELNYILPQKNEEGYNEVITSEIIDFFNICILDLINKSNTINSTEIIRDFNGWSWSVQIDMNGNIVNNLLFQNLLIIFGYGFYNDIVECRSFVELIERKIRKNDINEEQLEFLRNYIIFALLEYNNKNIKYHKNCVKYKELLNKNIEKAKSNQKKYIERISEENVKLNAKVNKLNLILQDKMLLKTAYINQIQKKGNTSVTVGIYARYLEKKKENMINEIKNNKLRIYDCENKNFELKEFTSLFKKIEEEVEIVKLKKNVIDLQKIFMKNFNLKIKETDSKKELYNLVAQFRYYSNLLFKKGKKIYEIDSLKESYNETIRILTENLIKNKVIENVFSNIELNCEIIKNVMKVNTIDLENISIKIEKNGETQFEIQYYDGNILENRVQLSNIGIANEFNKKTRKIKLFKMVG